MTVEMKAWRDGGGGVSRRTRRPGGGVVGGGGAQRRRNVAHLSSGGVRLSWLFGVAAWRNNGDVGGIGLGGNRAAGGVKSGGFNKYSFGIQTKRLAKL